MPLTVICPSCQTKMTAPDKAAGRRAKCPHCNCALQGSRPASTFHAVSAAFVQAVRDLGYTVNSLDKQGGRIVFKTGTSRLSFGQKITVVILDNGDGTCRGDSTAEHQGLIDWGEGQRIVQKVTQRAVAILAYQGYRNCLR